MLAPTEVTAKALGGQLMDFAVVTVEVQYAIGDDQILKMKLNKNGN